MCLWNPVQDIPFECQFSIGGWMACECDRQKEECSLEYTMVEPSWKSIILLSAQYRPEGQCEEIPCGTCYEPCFEICFTIWKCVNADLEIRCDPNSNPSECQPRIVETYYRTSYQSTGNACCYDVL